VFNSIVSWSVAVQRTAKKTDVRREYRFQLPEAQALDLKTISSDLFALANKSTEKLFALANKIEKSYPKAASFHD
jgi:hypothetical protein